MMTGFTVHGDTSKLITFTTRTKAQHEVDKYSRLKLFIVERPVSFIEWVTALIAEWFSRKGK